MTSQPRKTSPAADGARRDAKRRADRERQRRNRALARGEQPPPVPPRARRVYLPVAARTGGLRGAACAGQDPDLWFSDRAKDKARAKAICRGCPVLADCHAKAEANREQYGIWAGIDRSNPAEVRKARAA